MTTWTDIESWFSDGLKIVETYVLPVAVVAAAAIPGLPAFVPIVLGALPSFIGALEQAVPESGNGPLKKQGLLMVVQTICDNLDKSFTGGAANTWKRLEPVVSSFADNAIGLINHYAPEIISDEGSPIPKNPQL